MKINKKALEETAKEIGVIVGACLGVGVLILVLSKIFPIGFIVLGIGVIGYLFYKTYKNNVKNE